MNCELQSVNFHIFVKNFKFNFLGDWLRSGKEDVFLIIFLKLFFDFTIMIINGRILGYWLLKLNTTLISTCWVLLRFCYLKRGKYYDFDSTIEILLWCPQDIILASIHNPQKWYWQNNPPTPQGWTMLDCMQALQYQYNTGQMVLQYNTIPYQYQCNTRNFRIINSNCPS